LQGCRPSAGPRPNLQICLGWELSHFRPQITGEMKGLPAPKLNKIPLNGVARP
jgi:hypothetical protein